MEQLAEFITRLFGKYIVFVERFRLAVILVLAVLSILAVNYTINNLGMNTDTKDMLSPELQWRQLDLLYEQHFPQYTDNILIVVESPTPDQALDSAKGLYQRLQQESGLFKSVYYPGALSVFTESALLYLDIDELQDLADSLSKIQPFLYRLTDDPSLRGLFNMLTEALAAMEDGEEISLTPILTQIDKAVVAATVGDPYRVSWQNLMSGDTRDRQVYREFIILQPVLDYSNLMPATDSIDTLRGIIDQLELSQMGSVVRLTGSAVLAHEEMQSVTRGTEIAMFLSLCMVSIILVFGLRSIRLVVFTLLTLVTGLLLTAAFATMTVGKLNLISVAFAVLYIGLGVDFALHYCLRYRELRIEGMNNSSAIEETSRKIGASLLICAITTAIGFFAFIPTDYDGVAELGWISGFGMFISLIVTISLLPALLNLFPLNPARLHNRSVGIALPARISNYPITHARTIRITSLVIAVILAGLLTGIHFDYNTLNLQDPDNPSVQTYQDLLSDTDTSPWTGIILADGKQDAIRTSERLSGLTVVDKVVWINDFVPKRQQEKLAIIDDLNLLLLGGIGLSDPGQALTGEQRLEVLNSFHARLDQSTLSIDEPAIGRLHQHIGTYLEHLTSLPAAQQAASLEQFSQSTLASLPGRLEALSASLNASEITLDNLPQALRERWKSVDGHHLLEIYPAENLNENHAMRQFVEQIREVDPRMVGSPVINLMASDAVKESFAQAFSYSLVAITLLLLILLPHKRDTAYIMGPLIMAAVCTGGISVLLEIPLNFANIIALPLLLGIGVDSGIHIMHRFHTALPDHNNVLSTSSARAVIVSALTTICSIGNLSFSPHLGMASMGKLLTLGIVITLFAMLIVLPSLLTRDIGTTEN